VGASVERFIHFSTTDVYGFPGGAAIDEAYTASRFRNWYAETKRAAEAEVRCVENDAALDAVILRPATVYGPGSTDVIGEIASAIRGRRMILIGGGRAVAGLCYVENLVDAAILVLGHQAAPGRAFNVSDGLPVTWREFVDDLAAGLDCPKVGLSLPYWIANGLGFSLEHAYRVLRRTVGLSAPPLLSRQAVQVLGKSQDFSNRRAREMLGWEPRVGYAAGLSATLDWLRTGHLTL
jgi:nucleoside-diphosphate-sugar epimerase